MNFSSLEKRLALFALVFLLMLGQDAATAQSKVVMGPPPKEGDPSAMLQVFFVDVEQGDAIFLRVGNQTLLIDCGYPAFFQSLHSFLRTENGSLQLGSMLSTHPHEDHLGGLLSLLKGGAGAARFYGSLPENSNNPFYQTLFPLLAQKNIPYTQLRSGDLLELGGSGPDQGAALIQSEDLLTQGSALLRIFRWESSDGDTNDHSLVVQVEYGLCTLLLTADITGVAQSAYAKTYGDALSSDVLKSPHHGVALCQTAFLDAVSPELVMITNNPSNAPRFSRQMMKRGWPTLFSGQGTVRLASDGQRWYAEQQIE